METLRRARRLSFALVLALVLSLMAVFASTDPGAVLATTPSGVHAQTAQAAPSDSWAGTCSYSLVDLTHRVVRAALQ